MMQNSYSSMGIRGSIGYVAPGDWNSSSFILLFSFSSPYMCDFF
jgi:hypothetical protein